MPETAISREQLVAQLRALGVREGGVLLVHTSFRRVRPVDGGPAGLIAALREALGPGGTLVMPSWTEDDESPFDPRTTRSATDLGVVAGTFALMPGVRRSDHPFAFAAMGARAEEVVRDPLPIPPHRPESPVGRVHELDGQVLLLGVDHDADTTIHLAEALAPVPYSREKHITVVRDGRPVRIDYRETDHCCSRFTLVGEWLRERGRQREGTVGHARALLARSRDVVAAALERLREEPTLFLHPRGSGCEECEDAWRSVG